MLYIKLLKILVFTVKICIDENDKKYISDFCDQIGIFISGLYNMFTKQVIREGKIPFEVGIMRRNRKTIKAI